MTIKKSIVSVAIFFFVMMLIYLFYQDNVKIKFSELILNYNLTDRIEYSNVFTERYQTGKSDEDKTIKIGIIDGQIEIDHDDFINTQITQKSFVSNVTNQDIIHGTSIAGVLAANKNGIGVIGVSPENIEIYNSIVMSNGFASQEDVIAGIYYSIENEVDIINISIEFNIFTKELKQALIDASNNEILTFISNGNGNLRTFFNNPESLNIKDVYLVGALNMKNEHSKYNSRIRKADLYYPGEQIFSTSINDTYDIFNGSSYATVIATSHAVNLMKTTNKADTIKYFKNFGMDV